MIDKVEIAIREIKRGNFYHVNDSNKDLAEQILQPIVEKISQQEAIIAKLTEALDLIIDTKYHNSDRSCWVAYNTGYLRSIALVTLEEIKAGK